MPAFRKDLKKMLASPSLTSGLGLASGATKSIYCCGKGKLVKKHEKNTVNLKSCHASAVVCPETLNSWAAEEDKICNNIVSRREPLFAWRLSDGGPCKPIRAKL